MDLNIKESKFGDIILWDKTSKKFIVVRNYYKLTNALKANSFEMCCMSLGNGSFVCLKELRRCTWYEARKLAKAYSGTAPIKSYLPSIDKLKSFYPLIKEFNRKINKLNSLGIVCDRIRLGWYWSSTEYSSSDALHLGTSGGRVSYGSKYNDFFVRAFVAF